MQLGWENFEAMLRVAGVSPIASRALLGNGDLTATYKQVARSPTARDYPFRTTAKYCPLRQSIPKSFQLWFPPSVAHFPNERI